MEKSVKALVGLESILASEAKGRGFDPRQPHHVFIPAIIATAHPMTPITRRLGGLDGRS